MSSANTGSPGKTAARRVRTSAAMLLGLGLIVAGTPQVGHALTVSMESTSDAFLAQGSAGNPICNTGCADLNFGGAGTLTVSPASSLKGEQTSVVKWNLDSAVSQFNTAFGAGNWKVNSVGLALASNFGDQGEQPNNAIFNTINAGNFNVKWLSNNAWVEGTGSGMGTTTGGITYNTRNTLLTGTTADVGTFTYTPPGDNIVRNYNLLLDPNLVNNAKNGGDMSLYFTAADDQVGYLFNARSFAQNHPQLVVDASLVAPVPVPAALWLFGSGLAGVVGFARRRNTSAPTASQR